MIKHNPRLDIFTVNQVNVARYAFNETLFTSIESKSVALIASIINQCTVTLVIRDTRTTSGVEVLVSLTNGCSPTEVARNMITEFDGRRRGERVATVAADEVLVNDYLTVVNAVAGVTGL